MKSEDLITLAAAHGVDLLQAAKVASKPTGTNGGTMTKWVRGVKTTVLIGPAANMARGKQDHASVRPTWTLAELGICAREVPEIPFAAACFAFAGDRSKYWKLHGALFDKASRLSKNLVWPIAIADIHSIKRPYLAHLAKLVLDYDSNQSHFNSLPELFAWYMGVTERTWEHDLEGKFRELQSVWDGWLSTALGMIQSKLRGSAS